MNGTCDASWRLAAPPCSRSRLPRVAQADFAWTGGSTSPNWSDTGNWSGATAPIANTDVGALSFPAPSGCTGTCDSDNDRGGLSADSLTIDDNVRYALTGIGISLGSGGLTATSSGGSGGPAGIDLPLVLTAAQTWAFNGGAGGLDLQNAVTGGQAVTVNFASPAFLEFDASATLGSLTATGPGSLYLYGLGAISGPVALSNEMTLGNNALSSSTGALTLTGSELDDGYGSSQDATLAVNGAFAMDSASKLKMYIDQDGQNPGTYFSQLTTTGNVTLAGTLEVDAGYDGNGNCTPLSPGDTAELLSTTGTVTGTFDPHVVTNSSCDGAVPQIQITYGSSDVSAEVVSNTATMLAAPSTAQTNQPVTLTATVTPDTGSPTGTVAFDNGGTPIPGCSAQPVSSGTATCVASFSYSAPAPSLTASFTGTGGYLSSATTAASTITSRPARPQAPRPQAPRRPARHRPAPVQPAPLPRPRRRRPARPPTPGRSR